jgi:Amt family ammonium transporter
MWGLIAVGLLGSPERIQNVHGRSTHVGWFYSWSRGSGDATLLGAQLVGILFIVGWVVGIMLPFFVWLDWKGWFRSDPLEEIVGLDTSYHGGLVLTGEAQPAYITGPSSKRQEKDKFGGTENDFESDGENVVDA